jgi:hypothetical protein
LLGYMDDAACACTSADHSNPKMVTVTFTPAPVSAG